MNSNVLKKPVHIGDICLKNPVVIQPMEGCDGTKTGGISELTRRRYLRFAKSGAGIIWFEAVAVCPQGRANPRQLYLTEENMDGFASLIKEIKAVSIAASGYAPKIIIQLTHSGRQSRPEQAPEPVIVSNNKYLSDLNPLGANTIYADTHTLAALPAFFVKSALLAKAAGFDGVDIKCCHGYLFNELLSAYDRKDCYGGSDIENRARLYLDTYRSVAKAVGDSMVVTSRLGVYDGFPYPYGFGVNHSNVQDFSEVFYLIDQLIEAGLQILNVTIGNPYVNPHVNRPYRTHSPEDGKLGVERIRNITGKIQERYPDLAVVMSGMTYPGMNCMEDAVHCLENNQCTLVGFGRMAFAYPNFYKDYLQWGQMDKDQICITCGCCSKMMRAGGEAGCPIRDKEEYLPRYKALFPELS